MDEDILSRLLSQALGGGQIRAVTRQGLDRIYGNGHVVRGPERYLLQVVSQLGNVTTIAELDAEDVRIAREVGR